MASYEYKEILAELSRLKVRACENCGSDNWGLPHQEDDPKKPELVGLELVRDRRIELKFSPLTCYNCGNTRLIHIDTLMAGKNID